MLNSVINMVGGLLCSAVLVATAMAEDIVLRVIDQGGQPVENAVVSLEPLFESNSKVAPTEALVMQQQGALFSPFVLPVPLGATVSFPNLDEFRHHVYSFSKAKRFELRLYGQDESKQIEFDVAGAVALGCNIHDNMLAYIYVTQHPFFARSDQTGAARVNGLEAGTYNLYIWHPDLAGDEKTALQQLTVQAGSEQAFTQQVTLRAVRKRQRQPAEEDYN